MRIPSLPLAALVSLAVGVGACARAAPEVPSVPRAAPEAPAPQPGGAEPEPQADARPAQAPSDAAVPPSFDVILEGGRIVDGTGSAWYRGDLAIRDGRIEMITPPGMLAPYAADVRLHLADRVVAPGFIDIMSQSRQRFVANGDGRVVSKVTQGVTTEIMGEGVTSGPADQAMLQAAGMEAGRTVFATFGEWLDAMEAHGASVNFGSFIGASTIRRIGMGERMGEARGGQIKAMQAAVRQAMEDGAFGIASALIYPPGNFASTDELVAVNQAAARYGGVYATHMRSEADRLLEAIDEAIEIGARAGVPVEIYHLKAAGRRNWDRAALAMQKIDSARAVGLDVQANMYPYTAGATGLTACFPPWASADGRLLENLASPDARARMRAEIEAGSGDWENLCALSTPEGTLILGLSRPEHQRFVGRYLSEIAEELGKDWIDTAFDLVLAERGSPATIYFMMSEANLALQMRAPWMKFGTDAGGEDPEASAGPVHPRSYGTYPRILGRYVREQGVLPLEEAVRKMTSAVATRLGIRDRGILAPGYFADVVVFDPERVLDRATYEDPHQVSVGVEHVLVNGVPVVLDGKHTGALPGRPVRGPGWIGHYR